MLMEWKVCWYRNREQNFHDELRWVSMPGQTAAANHVLSGWLGTEVVHRIEKNTIDVPVLFIQATDDAALPPSLSEGMERFVANLTRKEVDAGHWALWQKPVEINGMIREWLERTEKTRSNL